MCVCIVVMAIVYTDTEIFIKLYSVSSLHIWLSDVYTQTCKNTLHLITHAVKCFYVQWYSHAGLYKWGAKFSRSLTAQHRHNWPPWEHLATKDNTYNLVYDYSY